MLSSLVSQVLAAGSTRSPPETCTTFKLAGRWPARYGTSTTSHGPAVLMRSMYCFSSNVWPVAAKYCSAQGHPPSVDPDPDEGFGGRAEVVHVPSHAPVATNLKQAPFVIANGVPVSVVGVNVLPSGLVTAPVATMCIVNTDSARRV